MEEAVRKNAPPQIPVEALSQSIIIEKLILKSKIEKEHLAKNLQLLDKEQLRNLIKQKLESTNDILTVWEEHPYQGVIVAISNDLIEHYNLRVGDKIAYGPSEDANRLIVFNKKKYYLLRPFEIMFRYLTDKV